MSQLVLIGVFNKFAKGKTQGVLGYALVWVNDSKYSPLVEVPGCFVEARFGVEEGSFWVCNG